jgi:hypothetical protein
MPFVPLKIRCRENPAGLTAVDREPLPCHLSLARLSGEAMDTVREEATSPLPALARFDLDIFTRQQPEQDDLFAHKFSPLGITQIVGIRFPPADRIRATNLRTAITSDQR